MLKDMGPNKGCVDVYKLYLNLGSVRTQNSHFNGGF